MNDLQKENIDLKSKVQMLEEELRICKEDISDPALISAEYGVSRFRNVNSNVISYCQREVSYPLAANLIREQFNEDLKSLVLGGPGSEFPGDTKDCANVRGDSIPGYDGVRIPRDDNYYHVVETCHCLEHVAHIKKTFSEIHRVLKVGGYSINIIPDVRYHKHDLRVKELGETCYNEWEPEQFINQVVKFYIDHGYFKLIQFDLRKNKLDFDVILKKLK